MKAVPLHSMGPRITRTEAFLCGDPRSPRLHYHRQPAAGLSVHMHEWAQQPEV